MSNVVRLAEYKRRKRPVCFTRAELNQLLSLYTRRVMRGDWKDYAIDHGATMAAFSVFQSPSAGPVFSVVKYAPGTGRGGDFVLTVGRRCHKRGATLADVLSEFGPDLRIVSS